MQFELLQLDPSLTYADLQKNAYNCQTLDFAGISCPSFLFSQLAPLVDNDSCKLTVVIDHPLGASCTQAKLVETIQAVKSAARRVDFTLNHSFVINRRWQELQEELRQVLILVKEYRIEFRPVLNFILYPNWVLADLLAIFRRLGISQVALSPHPIFDDDQVHDGLILAAAFRQLEISPAFTICSLRSQNLVETLQKGKINTLRVTNL